ncbi:RNA polymerase sigma factor [Conexibacter sp. JD483]|uniref:RNA polymerase sigma factor n=1 Tax=unclassified Conexibacter TaxID=2627773 RepID=UPI00271BCDA8|nr:MULTISPECIES: RNA polymerase sigma factor [unclassified Conexibacter]MDO8187881.1 RNA polymerase sigma factor [Conexibacter sp. CPCC 205706]MDO8201233.1 RNA polymerase sigma factor [Conexibacter sp. CPCC 205762]MDR9369755.1 RNA polymerase sigma factor [Conexibacter sp. JD483]
MTATRALRPPRSPLARSRDDAAAFAEVYGALEPKLRRWFLRQTRDGHLARELTAETFAKAFEKRHGFRGDSELEAAAWLWAIARNMLNAHWRERELTRAADLRLRAFSTDSVDERLARVEQLATVAALRDELREALTALAPAQQVAIRMRVLEERDYDEIAALLGVSREVARARVSRGLRELASSRELRRGVAAF